MCIRDSCKRCPKNRNELIRDNGYTGKRRDFYKTLKQLSESLGTDIHYVDVTNMSEIKELAKKSNQNLKDFGLHDATLVSFLLHSNFPPQNISLKENHPLLPHTQSILDGGI